MNRLFIYPKDISIITGKSVRWSQKLINNIKFVLNKGKHQGVSVQEFCDYMGLELNLVIAKFKWCPSHPYCFFLSLACIVQAVLLLPQASLNHPFNAILLRKYLGIVPLKRCFTEVQLRDTWMGMG